MDLELIGKIVGGIGLFLIGVELIRNGFKEAAGNSLRHILSDYTDTTARALFSGFIVSSLIQSSSAVAITMIGFVNARILRLKQAITVDFGSNLGKILTAWFIVLLGLKVNIAAYALPMVGIGAFLKTLLKKRHQGYGLALIGFALLFLGISTLKQSIDSLAPHINLNHLAGAGVFSLLVFFGMGMLMTIITQSSIAALTIALTAVSAHIIPVEHTASMIIGLNLGTTSSSYLAALRASSNARRLAVAHVSYNLTCTLIGIVLLGVIFFIPWFAPVTKLINAHLIVGLTSFYAAFIFLPIFVMVPMQKRFVKWLKQHFTNTKSLAHPIYLPRDKNIDYPADAALEFLQLEVIRLGQITIDMFRDCLEWRTKNGWVLSEDLTETEDELDRLNESIHRFAAKYTISDAHDEITERIQLLCRASQHFELASDYSLSISEYKNRILERLSPGTLDNLKNWSESIASLARKIDTVVATGEVEELHVIHVQLINTDDERRKLRDDFIQSSVTGKIKTSQAEALINVIETTRRAMRELLRGASKLWKLGDLPEDEQVIAAEENHLQGEPHIDPSLFHDQIQAEVS